MKASSNHLLDSVEKALDAARRGKNAQEIVRLEIRRDRLQAKAFRQLQAKIARMPK